MVTGSVSLATASARSHITITEAGSVGYGGVVVIRVAVGEEGAVLHGTEVGGSTWHERPSTKGDLSAGGHPPPHHSHEEEGSHVEHQGHPALHAALVR